MPPRVLRPKKDVVGLVGDAKIKWKDGDIVWAKFDDFPWWPGQVHLEDGDNGENKIPVQWFGDYGDKIDSCERDKVLPFDESYKEKIKKEVNRPDKNSFQESIEQATRAQESPETKKKTNVTTRRRSARRIIMNKEKTSEDNQEDKKINAPSKRSARRRRSSIPNSPATNANTGSSNETNDAKNKSRRRKRNRPSSDSDTKKKEKEEQEENEEEDNEQNEESKENEQKEENFNELKNKAKKIIFDNNNDNQLNIFMGFIYYHCRTIMNENESTEFICNLFNIKENEFEKHLEDFDFEATKPERKRRRKNI